MKIASADFSMQAFHQSQVRDEFRESLRTWRGAPPPNQPSLDSQVSISESARTAWRLEIQGAENLALPSAPGEDTSAVAANDETIRNDPYLSMIKFMVELLTGRAIRTLSSADMLALAERQPNAAPPPADSAAGPAPRAGYGIEYERHRVHEETESARFAAEGVIHTSDGKEIKFKFDLQMERHYREESHLSLRAGDAEKRDPLVINFAGTAAQLVDQYFRFDLEGDGLSERLPMLAAGSGYLAFDRNGNGRIDSGRELFGPATNQGFTELALLDSDNNGWLDEADPMFSRLSIWRPGNSRDGQQELDSLAAYKIGAIGLTDIATPFELRTRDNRELGAIRSSGIAITENGRVNSVQELDLTLG